MVFKDLREFLDSLEARGDLCRIKTEVDWDEELGAIAQESVVRKSPALVFENIKGHQNTQGRKLSMNSLGNFSRIASTLSLSLDSHPSEILNVWRERTRQPIKPRLVSTGPCKENIKKGDDVNLFELPVAKLHAKDGGRYIATWHCNVTKDPKTDWTNIGMYRGMILDPKSIGVLYVPVQHWGIHGMKYQAMGKPMPMAIAIGTDPITTMAASAPFKEGVCEYDMASALMQEPLDLVKCETIDIEVPATSEIVLEGTVSLDPADFRKEGPLGEYPGYYSTLGSTPKPVFKVDCVTYRNDPILTSCCLGMGPDLAPGDADYVCAINMSAAIWDQLEEAGVRGVTGVWSSPDCIWTNVFISINKLFYGHAKQAASSLWGSRLGYLAGKYVVVVDSDVDIFNIEKINSAIANRTRGMEDVIIFPYTGGSPLDPACHPDIKKKTIMSRWDKVLIDATWPFDWEARDEWGGLKHPPSALAEPEMIEKVRNRWKEYGID